MNGIQKPERLACDWCVGNFRASSTSGWTAAVWGLSAKDHIAGDSLTPIDAKCSKGLQQGILAFVASSISIDHNGIISLGDKVTGFNCKRCNDKNDYAESNQVDGTYICFNCR